MMKKNDNIANFINLISSSSGYGTLMLSFYCNTWQIAPNIFILDGSSEDLNETRQDLSFNVINVFIMIVTQKTLISYFS